MLNKFGAALQIQQTPKIRLLYDGTRLAGTTWDKLKEDAMKPNYKEKRWFVSDLNHS